MANKNNKAQSLPLNTIVIAMLVIIVLLVIIVFFVSKFTDSGDTINQNSASICSDSNPALSTMYDNIGEQLVTPTDLGVYKCPNNYNEIKVIPRKDVEGSTTDQKTICCGKKK